MLDLVSFLLCLFSESSFGGIVCFGDSIDSCFKIIVS